MPKAIAPSCEMAFTDPNGASSGSGGPTDAERVQEFLRAIRQVFRLTATQVNMLDRYVKQLTRTAHHATVPLIHDGSDLAKTSSR